MPIASPAHRPIVRTLAVTALSAALLTACGGGDDGPVELANDLVVIPDGGAQVYGLPAGTYTVDVTASNNGVVISWVNGSGCATSPVARIFSSTCQLAGNGQLIVTNPTTFGLGASESTTIRVTRL